MNLDFSKVDWAASDYMIAQRVGCSQGAVREARRLHEAQPEDFACKQCGGSGLVEKWSNGDYITRRFTGFGMCACVREASTAQDKREAVAS